MAKKKKNSNYHITFEAPKAPVKKERKPLDKKVIIGVSIALAVLIIVGAILAVVMLSHDGTAFYRNRNLKDRDITYVEMSVKDYGKITLLLDATTAPKTVANFISLVEDGFYDGLTFHRVMENFMIQGGDPKADGSGGRDEKIYGEFSANGYDKNDLLHKRGVISMARSGRHYDENGEINKGYDTASCQFFICNADAEWLDGQYAAFGYVVDGMSVVDKITAATVKYTAAQSGTISDKTKQAVIEYIKVLDDYQP